MRHFALLRTYHLDRVSPHEIGCLCLKIFGLASRNFVDSSNCQCEMGTLYPGPPGQECEESGSVECDYRHCADPAYCPCLNYDDLSGQRCDQDEDHWTAYPDMSDCTSFFNCSAGCMEKILVKQV